jgi:hypothetical protein
MNTYIHSSKLSKFATIPPTTPNNSIQRKVGNNVICYNKHLGLVDMSQNVLVRNATGRKG